jgi:hypothetical protein
VHQRDYSGDSLLTSPGWVSMVSDLSVVLNDLPSADIARPRAARKGVVSRHHMLHWLLSCRNCTGESNRGVLRPVSVWVRLKCGRSWLYQDAVGPGAGLKFRRGKYANGPAGVAHYLVSSRIVGSHGSAAGVAASSSQRRR